MNLVVVGQRNLHLILPTLARHESRSRLLLMSRFSDFFIQTCRPRLTARIIMPKSKKDYVKLNKNPLQTQKNMFAKSVPRSPRGRGGGTPLLGLYGDVPLDRVWFFGLAVLKRVFLKRVYNLTFLCPKQGQLS